MSAEKPTSLRIRANAITIGTSQPSDLAHFYAGLLDLPVTVDDPAGPGDPDDGGWAQVRPPAGSGMTLNFEYERHHTPPTWPSTADGQNATQHLDIEVDDLDGAVRRAVELGRRSPTSSRKTTSGCCSTRTVIRSACSWRASRPLAGALGSTG